MQQQIKDAPVQSYDKKHPHLCYKSSRVDNLPFDPRSPNRKYRHEITILLRISGALVSPPPKSRGTSWLTENKYGDKKKTSEKSAKDFVPLISRQCTQTQESRQHKLSKNIFAHLEPVQSFLSQWPGLVEHQHPSRKVSPQDVKVRGDGVRSAAKVHVVREVDDVITELLGDAHLYNHNRARPSLGTIVYFVR